jgi:hypothetical protein
MGQDRRLTTDHLVPVGSCCVVVRESWTRRRGCRTMSRRLGARPGASSGLVGPGMPPPAAWLAQGGADKAGSREKSEN